MAVFKCKMCGGALEISNNETVATCEYCGTQQTLPRLDDERRANLYDRANHFRRNNEFDKAAGIYENILNEDNTDAEAYWSLVLCRYGIEYVEDPSSHKRVPTVNRAQYSSIFADKDYLAALQYADGYQSEVYESEAKVIDEIQKDILAISSKEDPFDVFICYKETDTNGRRTADSVYAQNIYKALTDEGYKVFFARITLEDKLGTAYEPYIFAALNSAKVMIVVGTKTEHFNAVWVKNEWSRYLALIRAGKKKTLIPVYQDMNPYDLPEEFSYIQAQDMAKIGFMQDLVRGIQKLVPIKHTASADSNVDTQIVDAMIKRAFEFLTKGDSKSAQTCLDTVYAYDSDNAMYYVGLLMIQNNCQEIDDLATINTCMLDSQLFTSAIENADDDLKENLLSYGYQTAYNHALTQSQGQTTIAACESALQYLDKIPKDILMSDADLAEKTAILREQLQATKEANENKIAHRKKMLKLSSLVLGTGAAILAVVLLLVYIVLPAIHRSNTYNNAVKLMESGNYAEALVNFFEVRDYKDSSVQLPKLEELLLKQTEIGDEIYLGSYPINGDSTPAPIAWVVIDKTPDKALLISKNILAGHIYSGSADSTQAWKYTPLNSWLNINFYNQAFNESQSNLFSDEEEDPIFILNQDEIERYFPTTELRKAYATEYAKNLGVQSHNDGYSDWWVKVDGGNNNATIVNNRGEISDRWAESQGPIGNPGYYSFKETKGVRPAVWVSIKLTEAELSQHQEELYNNAISIFNSGDYNNAILAFTQLKDYSNSAEMIQQSYYELGNSSFQSGNYEEAINYYEKCEGYSDSTNQIIEAKYQYCITKKDAPDSATRKYIKELAAISYKNAHQLQKTICAWKANVTITVGSVFGIQSSVNFSAQLSGGDGGSTTVKFIITHNGQTDEYTDGTSYTSGATPSCSLSSIGDITKDYFSVSVYDNKGNLIGQASGSPK